MRKSPKFSPEVVERAVRMGLQATAPRELRGDPLSGGAADAPAGLRGVIRGKGVRTTVPDAKAPCPRDRVNRQFRTERPNQLWVSDFT